MPGKSLVRACILTLILPATLILLQQYLAGCGDDYNPCPKGQYVCGNMCVDFEFDDNHCGECDNACGIWSDCERGVCECVEDHADCDEEQSNGCEVDLTNDQDHCGSCDLSCETGQTCVNGVCR
jgi:hypothetical protein